MTTLLEIREYIKGLYARFGAVLTPLARFAVALIALGMINSGIGYNETLKGALPTVIVALFCALIPANAGCALIAVVILVHMYSLSLLALGFTAMLFLLLFLLYFRFTPRTGILVVLTPVCLKLGIPYVVPLSAGLFTAPESALSIVVGVVVYYYLVFIGGSGATTGTGSVDQILTSLRSLMDGISGNHSMIIMALTLAVGAVIVCYVRRLRIAHAWSVAVAVSSVVMLIVLFAGDIAYNTGMSIGMAFLGMIVSAGIAEVLVFFFFNMDYSRIESVQFQDDDYYYYVKAVPKVTLAAKSHTVQRFSGPEAEEDGIYYNGPDDFDYQNIDEDADRSDRPEDGGESGGGRESRDSGDSGNSGNSGDDRPGK